jgi:hypothetical protein
MKMCNFLLISMLRRYDTRSLIAKGLLHLIFLETIWSDGQFFHFSMENLHLVLALIGIKLDHLLSYREKKW